MLLKKHWEWESTRILSVDLLDFDSAVGEEVVENVVLVSTIVGSILPEDVEAKDFSIIVKEALKSLIWSTTFKLNLNIVLDLSLIRWSLFKVDHSSSMSE